MEPLDPTKNIDGSGFSKRRISSILKAPRKSARFPDPEQQENVVECTKPVEKRNSRRVSFAPANDVLLFSKDAKNASDGQTPLQELLTAAAEATQNRVQVAVSEDGSQQILGMETLLNAPLHTSQQREKVTFDSADDFGEKTVMFSTEDAVMDMTHSHTINIASDAELLGDVSRQNFGILPTGGEKRGVFTVGDGFTDMTLSHSVNVTGGLLSRIVDLSGEKKTSLMPCLDPGFENFLASLSKPSSSSTNAAISKVASSAGTSSQETSSSQMKPQRADVDKENQAPTRVSAVLEKSLNSSRRIRESSYGSALCPKDDMSMDLTEAQTGCFLGVDDDDDPFQCLFPTQDMYASFDKRVAATTETIKTKQQDKKPLMNSLLNAPQARHKVTSDAKPDRKEKTVVFTADELMDMTQSHTVNITSGSVAPEQTSTNSFNPGFNNFLSSLSKPSDPGSNRGSTRVTPSAAASSTGTTNTDGSQLKTPKPDAGYESLSTICPEEDVSMDMTEAQTGRIIGAAGLDDPFQFLFPSQGMFPHSDRLKTAGVTPGQQSREALGSSDHKGMETSLKPSFKAKVQKHQDKLDPEDDYREKTLRFSADDACMDVTRSHTVNIATGLKLQSHQTVDFLPTCGEKTLRFAANDAAMNMTQSLTVDIASNIASNSSFIPLKKQAGEMFGPPRNRSLSGHGLNPASNNGGMICPEDDTNMDMTEAQVGGILEGDAFMDRTETQTGRIIGILGTDDPLKCLFPTKGPYTQSGDLKRAETTSSQQNRDALGPSNSKGTVASSKTPLKPEMQTHQVKTDVGFDCRDRTVRFTADEACMDVTQSHTVNIATDLSLVSHQNMDLLPANGEKTVRFGVNDAAMDVTRSHTVNISTDLSRLPRQHVDLLPTCGEKTVRFNANDTAMDVTKSHTVNIATDFHPKSRQNVDFPHTCGEKTVRFTANDAAMDVTKSHTININLLRHQNMDLLPATGEKTVRFNANDAAMDVTRSHTVNIATDLSLLSNQKVDLLPAKRDKTLRFTANDAAMDVTKSHTVNIATDFNRLPRQNVDRLPTSGEKTVRFNANEAAMDVTKSHTVNINLLSRQNVDLLPANGEKTVKFGATEAAMDVTRSHTVNIAADFDPNHQNVDDLLPPNGEKTLRFTTNDATMDMTHCLTVNIASNESVLPQQHVRKSEASRLQRNRSSEQASVGEFQKEANDIRFPHEAVDPNGFLVHLKPQKPDGNYENETPELVSASKEKPVDKSPEFEASMDMTEAQTGYILEQTCTDEPPRFLSSTQNRDSELLEKVEVTLPRSNEGSSDPDGVEITKITQRDPELSTATRPSAPKMESPPGAADQDTDTSCSRKSRRKSLADLQSKVRRLSHMISAAPDAVDTRTAPLPQLDQDPDRNSKDKTVPLPEPEPEPELEMINTEDKTQVLEQPPVSATTTPFSLKTKQLMSRLSVGGFKPKLPQRSKPDDPQKARSAGEHTRTMTINVTQQLSGFDNDVSDIYDEELGSYEDVSETLDTRSPESPGQDFNMVEPLEEDVFEDNDVSSNHGQKRPLPEDVDYVEDEKRMRASPEADRMASQSDVADCESSITAAGTTSQSIHHSSSRYEAASESTIKHSLFESQLEDYASDAQKKLEDGTITVLEFFKLFSIDFVIHNPRQSVLPGRLLSDTDATSMDLLRDKHISRPKQMVYEADVRMLTEEVERLKVRMWDLDKPLKTVNRRLWEEMRHSSEKELKCFGAKLKERNNFFRKTSKVQSHEMKEILYSKLVQANLEEQQKLRGTIEQADEMMKSLDDCIQELETELAAVEENGFEDKPSLNSLEKEMKKVTETLAANDREICELEMEQKQNSTKLERLKVGTRNLENHIDVLNTMNEWRFKERRDNSTVYTFLHETLQLHLVYEESNGSDAEFGSERKVADIAFRFELDDEKSQFYARLVHKLLSQYTEGESDWVQKYPTSRHVPKLLHDFGLVVSRCRLLGEELRLLKMWGGLRLDVLDISCVDTRIHVVFSSLKKLSKFEVVFGVSLTNNVYVLQVESFRNVVGNTTIQQIEDITASFVPAKKLLTKAIKKIHDTLLC